MSHSNLPTDKALLKTAPPKRSLRQQMSQDLQLRRDGKANP